MNIWFELYIWSVALVGIRAFQQKNVQGNHYALIIPTSYVFAVCDIGLLYQGLQTWEISMVKTAAAVGTGAWQGCWLSLYLHGKLRG